MPLDSRSPRQVASGDLRENDNTTLFFLGVLCVFAVNVVSVVNVVAASDLPVFTVDRDNFEIRESARVAIGKDVIVDAEGNGVIHVIGEGLTVDFTGAHLRGAARDSEPDRYEGIGVRITGSSNTIRGGRFSGFKVAIFADNADGLTIEDVDVSDNFRQRLRSTPEKEAVEDWLRPHENDNREWMTKYGAGVSVEASDNVTIRRVFARNVQNGILLSLVNDARIYDNDCSFLSGWGLAMWRSHGNTISRNAFDFCVRGYSHGVYNRGQDSAGILMFEQCTKNIIAENSATHGGDGFFGFAGREALGEVNPREDMEWYRYRGNNENILIGNDFSYAAAHGVEMTFSFGNQIVRNRLAGNAICGVWGGFSQDTLIAFNDIEENGDMPYGSERGGVNIEHGFANRIMHNEFRRNAAGFRFWMRDDHPILELPWAKVNHRGSADPVIAFNNFRQDAMLGEVIATTGLRYRGNDHFYLGSLMEVDDISAASRVRSQDERISSQKWDHLQVFGETTPVGARDHLRGREHIVMTEWGPYDWSTPRLHLVERHADRHVYRVLGDKPISLVKLICKTAQREEPGAFVRVERDDDARTLTVLALERDRVLPYRIEAATPGEVLTAEDVLIPVEWEVMVFSWDIDPRVDVEGWRSQCHARISDGRSIRYAADVLSLPFRMGGPSQLARAPETVKDAWLPVDRFGTIAMTRLTFPPGTWRARTVAADGVMLWLDNEKVIEDWDGGEPGRLRTHTHEFKVAQTRTIDLRVEQFDLEGYATLAVEFEYVE